MYLGDGMGVVVESCCLFFLVSCMYSFSFIISALLSSSLSHSLSFLLMELYSFLLLVVSFLFFSFLFFSFLCFSLLLFCIVLFYVGIIVSRLPFITKDTHQKKFKENKNH